MNLERLRDIYEEKEVHISTVTLVGGFIFDSLTMKNIDSFWDNVWIIFNIVSICVCLVLLNKGENEGEMHGWRHFWLFNILQFSFGAVLGASFIFYFRSATLAVSWPFILILLSATLANEYLKKHYERLVFQVTFLFFTFFIFSIFFLPLIFHRLGVEMFLASGGVSLVLIWLITLILRRDSGEKIKESWNPLWGSILCTFALINILYFTNLIPPIPLSLKEAGIYHMVVKDSSGNYLLSGEEESWIKKYFGLEQDIHWTSGQPLYAYTAIYAPGSVQTQIIHEWQYTSREGEWLTATRIPLNLSGGRDNGFRTYSVKSALTPGQWRVNVTNTRGQVLGRIKFKII